MLAGSGREGGGSRRQGAGDGDAVRRDRGGGRCAGSPTAMLLARKGYRVLVVDRATFPSDTRVDPLHPPAGRRRARSAGACSTTWSPPAARRSTRTSSTSVRSRSPGRRSPSTAAPRRTRPGAPCSTRSSSTPPPTPGPRCARASPSRRSSSTTARHRHPRPGDDGGATVTEQAAVVIGADGRNSLVAKAVEPEQYNERADRSNGATTRTGAACRSTGSRCIRGPTRLGRVPDQRRPDARRRRVADAPSSRRLPGRRRGQLSQDLRAGARVRRAGPRRDAAKRASPAPATCRTSSASRTGRDGRWSATPDTTRTRSPRSASPTRSATPSCCVDALDESFAGGEPFDDAMARVPADSATKRLTADVRVHLSARDAGAAAARDAAAPRRRARQPRGDGRLRQCDGRHPLTGRVLQPRNIGRIMGQAG